MKITQEIKKEVSELTDRFNKTNNCLYRVRFKGDFSYFDKKDFNGFCKIFRLQYKGNIDNWDFAIYKYSSEKYDPDEFLFPGDEFIDGTIEGALKAGLRAYPD